MVDDSLDAYGYLADEDWEEEHCHWCGERIDECSCNESDEIEIENEKGSL